MPIKKARFSGTIDPHNRDHPYCQQQTRTYGRTNFNYMQNVVYFPLPSTKDFIISVIPEPPPSSARFSTTQSTNFPEHMQYAQTCVVLTPYLQPSLADEPSEITKLPVHAQTVLVTPRSYSKRATPQWTIDSVSVAWRMHISLWARRHCSRVREAQLCRRRRLRVWRRWAQLRHDQQ